MSTPKTALTETANGQANYLNVNEALNAIDQLIHQRVVDKDLSAPPGSPANGAAYIVASSPTGDWSGKAGQIAYWLSASSAWTFLVPGADDRWVVRVSDENTNYQWNGSAWSAFLGEGRELLTANRTYYVRADGSDSNNGLADTSGGAFLTIQKAVNTAASIDIGIYDVTISVSPGSYDEGAGVKLKNLVGSGRLIIVGSGGSPSDVSVSTSGVLTTTDAVFTSPGASGRFYVDNLALSSTGSGARYAISASGGSTVEFGNVEFGSGFSIHILAFDAGVVRAAASYSVTGGGAAHSSAGQNGVIRIASVSVTITGTPAFATAFAISTQSGVQVITGVTFSGSATGPRYSAVLNGVINTNGAGASYLPGNSAGATATGGQYA